MKNNKRTLHSFIIIIYQNVFFMLSIDKIVSPNETLIKTIEGELTFDVIKEYAYDNPMRLMLLW